VISSFFSDALSPAISERPQTAEQLVRRLKALRDQPAI